MIRSGSEHDTEYYITIEKVLGDEPENYEYKIIEQYLMTNGDTNTMKKALEEYLMHASKLNLAKFNLLACIRYSSRAFFIVLVSPFVIKYCSIILYS